MILRGTLWGACFIKKAYYESTMMIKVSKHNENN